MNQAERERYCRQVRKRLTGPRAEREAYWKGWMENVAVYLDQYPETSLEDLESRFGTPEKVAEDFLAEAGPEVIRTFSRRRKVAWAFAVCALVAVLALCGVTWMVRRIESEGFHDGYVPPTYTEENAPSGLYQDDSHVQIF